MHDVIDLITELRRYVADDRVLDAVATVPRELFVPAAMRERAYDNSALGIGCGQTISQPLVVARMTELLALRPTDRVLDVGTGSGYHAAILAQLAEHVWSIERHQRLSRRAARNLREAGVTNVTLVVGDGTLGLPDEAPFDAINVAAAGSAEALADLEDQLAGGGRLVAPVSDEQQRLVVTRRTLFGLDRELFEEVRFVPLVRDG
jgi:protein-L-isoaspartate(D-aspartate) O-methyltransferase